jgi:hypothetical protein
MAGELNAQQGRYPTVEDAMKAKKPYQSPELVLLDTEENESKHSHAVNEAKLCVGPGQIVPGTPGVPCLGVQVGVTIGPS